MSADLRIEAALKVAGRAVFPAETPATGLLYAALVEAPVASGELRALDPTAARAVPGFVDIVGHAEAEGLKASSNTALIRERTIHFAGQPLALVVAESPGAAEQAARAVRLEIEARPAVTALDQALDQAYAPKLAGRVPAETRRGDAATAIAGAHLVVRGRYETAVNNHHPMEPHAAVCVWEGERPTVHTNTQAVFGTRAAIAHAFQLPADDIRVVARYLGGGFGCKGPLWWPWMFLAMIAARRAGRPVRLELSRAQLFTLVGRRQETVQELALGFGADGRLVGIEHDVLAQTSTHGEYVDATAAVSRWLYACPNVSTTHRLVRTNEPQPIPMRAPGVAPGTFALESALDEAAERLGLDPVELRVRNFADRDQQADKPWSSNGLLECYRVGAERFGWAGRPAPGAARDGRWRLGSGMATACYPVHRQPASARVRISGEGALTVQCGTQDMGSGTYTVLGQMAAAQLGVAMADVTVELGDTWLPEGPYSGGSMVTLSILPAAEAAARQVRAQLAELAVTDEASPLAGLPVEDLEFADGLVRSRSGNAAEPLVDLLRRRAPAGLEAEASATPPEASDVSGMGYGAVFVEVGIDPDLGELRVRRVTAAYAAGRILNPLLAKSQHVGGLIGGIGMALHERTVTDRATGRILGDGFADYLIPVHADMPEFDIALVDEHDPHLPGGVKGIGMLGSAGVQAAIANAVHDAIGRRVRHLPIRIEDLL
ncbi:MAG: xanthine dehydrogenase family protein molybdopterin-binding subunit [Caulobacterales bacterium]|nr:xanthine dehydrogenase family protein molybdopterin-binding subunit [Caulobacterales bacterium]